MNEREWSSDHISNRLLFIFFITFPFQRPPKVGGGAVGAADRGALLSSIQGKGIGGLRKVADNEKKDRSAALEGNKRLLWVTGKFPGELTILGHVGAKLGIESWHYVEYHRILIQKCDDL